MHILLSNDDGYFAPGLAALYEALLPLATVTVVAPERDKSGASNSLTLDRPLSLRRAANGFFFLNGTPTDCVHMAVTGMLDFVPDMVVAGINHGSNMGDDTIYSGTVAAATEGYLLGIPAIAISLVARDFKNFETAAWVAAELVKRHRNNPVVGASLLNVNVPDIPKGELQGFEVTRLGKRHKAEPAVKSTNPRGEVMYWIGAAGAAADAGPGTDFYATEHHRVSITPLQVDLTNYQQMPLFAEWMLRP